MERLKNVQRKLYMDLKKLYCDLYLDLWANINDKGVGHEVNSNPMAIFPNLKALGIPLEEYSN